MHLQPIDWAIMAIFFAVSLAIGIYVSRSAGKNFNSFFLGGKNLPWWLLGLSMVATTFSTDTPNLVADIVRKNGALGNWTWWAFLLTGMLTVFVYAKLWRRSEVLTDVEFYEIRYSGRIAAFLRGFRAIYLGVVFNIIIMATVTLAAMKIGGVIMGWGPWETILIASVVTAVYTTLGGLRGVVLTDLIQFAFAMVGSIAAAIYVIGLPEIGGLQSLLTHENVESATVFWPDFSTMSWKELLPIFTIPLAVQWWASYYPGSEPGGGGYIVQRMLSAKNEKHATGGTLLFNVLHYALRPWPWIIVALASLVVFPDLSDLAARFPNIPEDKLGHDLAYPAMITYLPPGLLGIVITSLAAAYMSTMSSQVNWGSGIIVNDFYLRFINPDASDRQQVRMGRICTVVLIAVACLLARQLESAKQVFDIVLQIGAGTGLLYLLRWFWWRINALSELVAMIVSFVLAVGLQLFGPDSLQDWQILIIVVTATTVAWVAAAFLGEQTSESVLQRFHDKIQPGGPGWKKYQSEETLSGGSDLPVALLSAVLGVVAVYSALFATGFFLYGRTGTGFIWSAIAVLAVAGVARLWPRINFR